MLSYLKKKNICKVADSNNLTVNKDECIYCFNTPEHKDGLYICMNTFISVCKDHLELFYQKTNSILYLNLRIEKHIQIDNEQKSDTELSDYKKLLKEAFSYTKFDIQEFNKLVMLPNFDEIKLPAEIPDHVKMSITSILSADSLAKAGERAAKAEMFDPNDYLQESKHSLNLVQLKNGVKIPPSGWKCSGCDLINNLWMNLSDGTILCGRKFADGSGGNNHAMEHYEKTKFPLAVKLGTITPESADVFSYEENDMVKDSALPVHLTHFGIDVMRMTKTDMTMEELELENIKQSREKIAIMESESSLETLVGPGLTGIVNTGNSCYINSVVQALFTIPAFAKFYTDRYQSLISNSTVSTDINDFRVQFAKLGFYLKTGDYSGVVEGDISTKRDGDIVAPLPGVTPLLFRLCVGRGHREFGSKQQQDVTEFLIHLLGLVKKDIQKHSKDEQEAEGPMNPLQSISFRVEDRVLCSATNTVSYRKREELVLSLPIPLDQAVNRTALLMYEQMRENNQIQQIEDKEPIRPQVELQACLEAFMAPSVIEGYISSTGKQSQAFHTSRLDNFPDMLWLQLKRFAVGADWTPCKLDVEILVPDQLDLTMLRATGLQSGEVEIATDNNVEQKPAVVQLDANLVSQLADMGFPEAACRKAVYLTGNCSLEEAANWLMIHVGEPDFETLPAELELSPLTAGGAVASGGKEEDIVMLESMGFSRAQAHRALRETGGSLERAADWAFNHTAELEQEQMDTTTADSSAGATAAAPAISTTGFTYSDGQPSYSLAAMISHMGSNTHVGHYVAHIKLADGSWALFNDEKVQRSQNPPRQFAYMYLYKRDN